MTKNNNFSVVKRILKYLVFEFRLNAWYFSAAAIAGLIAIGTTNAQLTGNYTINSGISTGGTNFQTFSAFVTALTSAGNSISGSVNVNIVGGSGPYNEQLILPAISGTSSGSRLTFYGNGQKITYNGTATENATITLNGTDYVTFSNLVIERGSTGTYRFGVRLNSGADFVKFDSCTIDAGAYSTTNQVGLLCSNSNTSISTSGLSFNGLELNKCMVKGGYYGVRSYGTGSTSGTWMNGVTIKNCTFEDVYYYPVYIYTGHYNVTIESNTFTKTSTSAGTYGYACYIYQDNNIRFIKNYNTGYSYGFYMYYTNYYNTSLVSGRSLVANNMSAPNATATDAATSKYGFYIYYAYDMDFVYNSVNVEGSSVSTCYALMFAYSSNAVLNNNSIKGNSTGSNYLCYFYNPSGAWVNDYNNFYTESTGGTIYMYAGTANYSSISSYISSSGSNANSHEANPFYISSTNLHINGGTLFQKGNAFSGVTDDFDGTLRPSVPSIGAHEFTPPQYDAGVTKFIQPVSVCPDTNQVIATVKNFGIKKLTSFKIHWTWTGNTGSGADSMQITASGTGIGSNNDTNLVLTSVVMTGGAPGYTFSAWTTKPSGQVDEKPANDKTIYSTQTAMFGTYTVGGTSPDFATLTAAATALNSYGVCDAVTINIRQGSYMEALKIGVVVGASSTNTITLQSDPANTLKPLIQYSAATTTEGTVTLSGTNWVTLKGLKIEGLGSTYGNAIHLNQTASNNVVMNCELINQVGTSTSSYMAVVYVYDPFSNYNSFLNNTISGGSYGVYHYGYTGSTPYTSYGATYIGNTVTNCYYRGIYVYYLEDVIISRNKIYAHSAYSTAYGMYAYFPYSNNIHVEGNEVHSNYYGIYFYAQGSSGSRPLLSNNKIHAGGSSATSGAYSGAYFNSTFGDVTYNTIISEGVSSAYYNLYVTGGVNKVYNNIIIRDGVGYCIYNASTYGIVECDNNNYIPLNGANLGYNLGTIANNLAAWQALGWDEHATDARKLFASYENLQTCNDTLVGKAKPLSNVPKDYSGTMRNTANPTIGPEEFINPGDFTLGDDVLYCPGDSVEIGREVANATYNWTPNGDSTATIVVTDAGTYGVTVVTDCGTGQASIVLEDASTSAAFTYEMSRLAVVFSNTTDNGKTYFWDFDDGATSTSESPGHFFKENGTYNVCLTSTGDCGDDVYCENITVGDYSGINAVSWSGDLVIYPNPASGVLTINVSGMEGELNAVEFSNISGQVVMLKRISDLNGSAINQIDISGFEKGLYLVKVFTNKDVKVETLIIQ